MPEVSGKIQTEVLIESPPRFFCASVCFTRTSHKFEGATSVEIPRLMSLPGPAGGVPIVNPDGSVAPYIKKRNPEDPVKHRDEDSFYGQDITLLTLPQIAQRYKKQSARHLSVNDMSLRDGGKFDVFGRWTEDHGEHRIGKSADINQEGIPCEKDRELRKAVNAVIPPEGPRFVRIRGARLANPLSRLLCETGGRKHIDFDGAIGLIP